MPVRLGSLRVPDISMEDWRKLSPAHRTVQQDLYLQRCQQRGKDKIKRLRIALKERTAAHTVSAMFAGTEIRVDGDLCKAEERYFDTVRPPLTPCASALGVTGQLGAEPPLEAKGAQWEPISAPAMPIRIVNEKEEHRHLIADFDFPFNSLVAEPVSKTQRKQLPKAQAACDNEWDKLMLRTTWDPMTVKEWSWVSQKSPNYWNKSSRR